MNRHLRLSLFLAIFGIVPAQQLQAVSAHELICNKWVKRAMIAGATAKMFWPAQAIAHWNWPGDKPTLHTKTITHDELNNVTFKKLDGQQFLFGTGSNELQDGGKANEATSAWCEMVDNQPEKGLIQPGIANDHWNRYKEDNSLLDEIGANAKRLSTSWSLIQPDGPHSFDEKALQHYVGVCDDLVSKGKKPVITIEHYDKPSWFFKNGYKGFEDERGIQAYVNYAVKLYDTLKDHGVHLWITFNSPMAYAINGYMEGGRPPALKGKDPRNMLKVRRIQGNLLQAHKRAYEAIHALYKLNAHKSTIKKPIVGISKNIYQVNPWTYQLGTLISALNTQYKNSTLNNIAQFMAKLRFTVPTDKLGAYMAYWLQDDVFFKFFSQPENQHCLDYIGLNYYSHGIMRNFKVQPDASEIPTNNDRYTVSPEGLLDALTTVNKRIAQPLSIPIYVIENGVAAGEDDELRATFLQRILYTLSHAQKIGIRLKGWFYWALMDNYEWGTYKKHYGLYAVDRTEKDAQGKLTLKRTLRKGAQPFVDIAKRHQEKA